MPDFGTFKQGGRPSASALQKIAGRLGELTPLIGKDGVNVATTNAGTTFSLQRNPSLQNEIFFAVISSNPVTPAQTGYYNAASVLGTITVNATANITTDQLGGLSPNDNCIIVNPSECAGFNGSPLPSGIIVPCKYVRTTNTGLIFGVYLNIGNTLPSGQQMGQVYMNVTDNHSDFSFLFLTTPD